MASVGGAPTHPAWYLNLNRDPEAVVQVGRRQLGVHADTTAADERARLWTLMTRLYPGYDKYQAKTSREIPVVVLTPLAD